MPPAPGSSASTEAGATWRSAGERARAVEQGGADMPVLDDEAQGVVAHGLVVVVQEERRVVVGDADLQDRLGVRRERGPEADAVQHPLGAERDGGDPPVECGILHRLGRRAVDDDRLDPGAAERDPEGEPDEAAARDDDVALDPRLACQPPPCPAVLPAFASPARASA